MLNTPTLKFDKSIKYLEDQLSLQNNNKQLILDIITNIGLILNNSSSNKENLQKILDTANEFLKEISSNITAIEQLHVEILNITKDLNNIISSKDQTVKTKSYYIASFSTIKDSIVKYTNKFQPLENKLIADNSNFNEFIKVNDFKYIFDSVENNDEQSNETESNKQSKYTFTEFSINDNTSISNNANNDGISIETTLEYEEAENEVINADYSNIELIDDEKTDNDLSDDMSVSIFDDNFSEEKSVLADTKEESTSAPLSEKELKINELTNEFKQILTDLYDSDGNTNVDTSSLMNYFGEIFNNNNNTNTLESNNNNDESKEENLEITTNNDTENVEPTLDENNITTTSSEDNLDIQSITDANDFSDILQDITVNTIEDITTEDLLDENIDDADLINSILEDEDTELELLDNLFEDDNNDEVNSVSTSIDGSEETNKENTLVEENVDDTDINDNDLVNSILENEDTELELLDNLFEDDNNDEVNSVSTSIDGSEETNKENTLVEENVEDTDINDNDLVNSILENEDTESELLDNLFEDDNDNNDEINSISTSTDNEMNEKNSLIEENIINDNEIDEYTFSNEEIETELLNNIILDININDIDTTNETILEENIIDDNSKIEDTISSTNNENISDENNDDNELENVIDIKNEVDTSSIYSNFYNNLSALEEGIFSEYESFSNDFKNTSTPNNLEQTSNEKLEETPSLEKISNDETTNINIEDVNENNEVNNNDISAEDILNIDDSDSDFDLEEFLGDDLNDELDTSSILEDEIIKNDAENNDISAEDILNIDDSGFNLEEFLGDDLNDELDTSSILEDEIIKNDAENNDISTEDILNLDDSDFNLEEFLGEDFDAVINSKEIESEVEESLLDDVEINNELLDSSDLMDSIAKFEENNDEENLDEILSNFENELSINEEDLDEDFKKWVPNNFQSTKDDEPRHKITPTDLLILYIRKAKGNNRVLIISERHNKIFLPYTLSELSTYMKSYPDAYESFADVVKQEFIIRLDDFNAHPYKTRFKEAYNLYKNRTGYSSFKSTTKAFNIAKINNLHPAIIAACKGEYELDSYLNCLKSNKLDSYKIFKIIYDINPM